MLEYRSVKTSTSNFLETRDGRNVLLKLTREIKLGDIGVLFTANDVVHLYALEHGELVAPESYSHTADLARTLIERAVKGKLHAMGQVWITKQTNAISIANVTLGAVKDGRFAFSHTGLVTVGCKGLKTAGCERTLTRLARLDILHREACV